MSKMAVRLLAALLAGAVASTVQTQLDAQVRGAGPPPATEEPDGDEPSPVTDVSSVVVVTASRREEQLINAPAAVTVITEEMLENTPGHNAADLLRAVPGLNVAQTAARDVVLNPREATGSLTDSNLALLDGRSIYQDFFGFVLWELLPFNTTEIKQIEVIRGPASAVWGANALTGVVNVITKTPREMLGTTVTFDMGQFERSLGDDSFSSGSLLSVYATHAEAPNDSVAFKFSAGILTQEALPRPTGTIPGSGMPYPVYTNRGTAQPRVDVRVDYDFPDQRQTLVFSGGVAGTTGIIHSGLGPFDVQPGTRLSHGKVNYQRGDLRVQFFVNAFTGDAPALLQRDGNGDVLGFTVRNLASDIEFSNEHILGTQHLLSYGGNYRHNAFDLSLAPAGDSRDEGGFYIQDEVFLSDQFRWVVGTRVDEFDVLDKTVFSPRTTFMFKPQPDQTFRISFNRAFRAPSFVNSFLDATLLVGPGIAAPAVGNLGLKEEALTAYEAGYIGSLGPATLSGAVYLNHTDDMILFTQSKTSPMGVPLQFTYLNFPRVTEKGVELSIDWDVHDTLSAFVNYSWQARPEAPDIDPSELNIPPRHRFNAGMRFGHGRYFGDLSTSYVDEAFWQDVLTTPFHGSTDPYTLVNGGFGVRSTDERLIVSVQSTNLLNTEVQQHIFGDIIKRSVSVEVQVRF